MSDFNQKPVTADVRALVHEVVDRLLDYNPTETTQETTDNKPTFYLDINGYSARIQVGIIKDGFPIIGNLKDVKRYGACLCEDDFHSAEGISEDFGEILTRMDDVYNQWQQKGSNNENKQN